MKRFQSWCLAAVAAATLVACGGGGDDGKNSSPYGKMVVFGDSLSDVGTHATQGVVLGKTGGKYTVNGLGVKIWPELLADELGVPALCAAKVGLEASGPFAALAQTPQPNLGCYDYAQGGSRVAERIGVANKALLPGDTSGYLGQLTEPFTTQLDAHLAKSPAFAANDLVTVMFGGNDVFINLAQYVPHTDPQRTIDAMGKAADDLIAAIKTKMIDKGATRIVVLNLPPFEVTPFFVEKDLPTQQLVGAMVATFNGHLAAGIAALSAADQALILQVDANARFKEFVADQTKYGLTNVKDRACDQAKAPTSLICSATTVVAGDVSHYAFADDVHPTPFAHSLIEQLVLKALVDNHWR